MLFALVSPFHTATADFTIVVDYTYDTNNFFDTQAKKNGLEAAADRFSDIINSSLTAVAPGGNGTTPADWRVGFTHPGDGSSIQLSTSPDFASDALSGSGAADVYGFAGLNADEWILYAGGRSLTSAGVGGTGTGTNFTSTFDDLNGPLHRGVISNAPGAGQSTVSDIPAWGGAISFDTGTTWHFDPTTAATGTDVDLYSIALHEIGHALGLSLSFNQWTVDQAGSTYSGANALAAYNADNGASETGLNQVSSSNRHFADETYDSVIFAGGNPNYTGTVGEGNLQDLLMEPTLNFGNPPRRFELTNVEVGALQDLGWSVVPEPSTFLVEPLAVLMFVFYHRRSKKRGAIPTPAA